MHCVSSLNIFPAGSVTEFSTNGTSSPVIYHASFYLRVGSTLAEQGQVISGLEHIFLQLCFMARWRLALLENT